MRSSYLEGGTLRDIGRELELLPSDLLVEGANDLGDVSTAPTKSDQFPPGWAAFPLMAEARTACADLGSKQRQLDLDHGPCSLELGLLHDDVMGVDHVFETCRDCDYFPAHFWTEIVYVIK